MRDHLVQGASKTRGGSGTLSQSRLSFWHFLERFAKTPKNLGGLGAGPQFRSNNASFFPIESPLMATKKSLQNNTAAGLENQTPSG